MTPFEGQDVNDAFVSDLTGRRYVVLAKWLKTIKRILRFFFFFGILKTGTSLW